MEAAKEDLEIKIANEKIAKPRISPEFVTFWLHKFRELDVRQQSHRKMLIDAFVNAIYLYDDKLVLTFNYKDGTRTITLDDVKEAVKNNTGSDLDCRGAPIFGAEKAAGFEPMKMQQSGGLLPPGVSAGCSIVYSSPAAGTIAQNSWFSRGFGLFSAGQSNTIS